MVRRPIWLVAAAAGLVLLTLGLVPVTTLLAPYSSRPIPTNCSSGSTHVPADRMLAVPGIGAAWVVATDHDAEVVFGSGTAYLLSCPKDPFYGSNHLRAERSAQRSSPELPMSLMTRSGTFWTRPLERLSAT